MKVPKDKSSYIEIDSNQNLSARTRVDSRSKLFKYGTVTIFIGAVVALVVGASVLSRPDLDSSIPIALLDNAVVVHELRQQAPSEVAPAQEEILVELEKGTIRGFKMTSRGGREFLAFRGIPYAKPPVGQLRFQPPEEIDPWDGVLDTTDFRPMCPQKTHGLIEGEEDCLNLNVYTPKKFEELSKRKRLPVMVYIHGGMAGGSARRNSGEYLMDQDVVLVGMNYRLGVLGNFNTNDSLARGNQGLRDQIKALEWIQENIKKFGGDKRKVTLFGNSYGSMAINTHLLSPMTKGLFHQVICESGEAIFPGHLQRHPAEIAVKLGNQLNCTSTNSSADLLQCLRSLPFDKVVLESFNVKPVGNNGFTLPGANIFTTSVDPKLEDVDEDDVYLPEQPLKLLMGGKLKRMPAIIGVNSGEGLFQSMLITQFENLTKVANEKWESILPVALTMDSPIAVNFSRAAREFYFGSNNISFQTRDNLTDLFSDRLGNHPAHTHAFYQKEANRRSQNVFLYYMTKEIGVNGSYFKPFGSIDWEERAELGPAHADEIQFLFPYEPFPLIPAGSKNANYSAMMVRLWADFARDGKPGLADNQAEWVPIKEKPYNWFQLDNEPKMINILEERMKFWDSFELSDLYV